MDGDFSVVKTQGRGLGPTGWGTCPIMVIIDHSEWEQVPCLELGHSGWSLGQKNRD